MNTNDVSENDVNFAIKAVEKIRNLKPILDLIELKIEN
jgi:hypothetical protein